MNPNQCKSTSGFAIFSVLLLVAIISLMSLAMVNTYLTNTRATAAHVQSIKAAQLLDSGVRFAALSIASPRAQVSGSAIPSKLLNYSALDALVTINIENEAGFIDLIAADRELLLSALLASGSSQRDAPQVIALIASLERQQEPVSYRKLRDSLSSLPVNFEALISISSLHNGQTGVHPKLASEKVLNLVPKLSKAERDRVLANQREESISLISNPVSSDFFTSTISAYYRISASVELQGQRYSRVQIIKMVNQKGRLYEIQATL